MIISQCPDFIRVLSCFLTSFFLFQGPTCVWSSHLLGPLRSAPCVGDLGIVRSTGRCFVELSPSWCVFDVFLGMRLGCRVCVGGIPRRDSAVLITSCQGCVLSGRPGPGPLAEVLFVSCRFCQSHTPFSVPRVCPAPTSNPPPP